MTAFDHDEFVAFLVRAKRATYASTGDEMVVDSLLPGAHQLEYAEGSFLYRDIYYGGIFFAGQETVFHQDQPVWSIVYAGGMLDDTVPLGSVLKEALRQVEAERPYRGPNTYQSGDYTYTDESHGTVASFHGYEVIAFQARPIYDLRYQGGFVH